MGLITVNKIGRTHAREARARARSIFYCPIFIFTNKGTKRRPWRFLNLHSSKINLLTRSARWLRRL